MCINTSPAVYINTSPVYINTSPAVYINTSPVYINTSPAPEKSSQVKSNIVYCMED